MREVHYGSCSLLLHICLLRSLHRLLFFVFYIKYRQQSSGHNKWFSAATVVFHEEPSSSSPGPPFLSSHSSSSEMSEQKEPVSTPPPSASSAAESLLHDLLTVVNELKTEVAEVKKSNARLLRRRTAVPLLPSTPLPSPPRVSAVTDPSLAKFRTPNTRVSMGAVLPHPVVMDRDLEEEEEERNQEESPAATEEEVKEAIRLAKVMTKMSVPEKFSGETEKDKEAVDIWVNHATAYMNGQFGTLDPVRYGKQRIEFIQSYLRGAASDWLVAAHSSDPTLTWEELQEPFRYFIKGGRESQDLWKQQMNGLKYGSGKCKDLLALEQEFERLRIKLYPTSSAEGPLNQRLGEDYGNCILRGDTDLYKEVLRLLSDQETPSLSTWKKAAARAVHIREVTRTVTNQQSSMRHGGGAGGSQRGKQGNRYGLLAEIDTGTEEPEPGRGGQEDGGETPSGGTAAIQRLQDRILKKKGPQRKPFLTDEEYRTVMSKQLCLQCYLPGHRIGDDSCKEKGKPRRKPTAGEIKA